MVESMCGGERYLTTRTGDEKLPLFQGSIQREHDIWFLLTDVVQRLQRSFRLVPPLLYKERKALDTRVKRRASIWF